MIQCNIYKLDAENVPERASKFQFLAPLNFEFEQYPTYTTIKARLRETVLQHYLRTSNAGDRFILINQHGHIVAETIIQVEKTAVAL